MCLSFQSFLSIFVGKQYRLVEVIADGSDEVSSLVDVLITSPKCSSALASWGQNVWRQAGSPIFSGSLILPASFQIHRLGGQ